MKDNAKRLLQDIEQIIDNWDERSCFIIRDIKNISMSDLDTLKLYIESIQSTGGYKNLINPRGNVEKVLRSYNLMF